MMRPTRPMILPLLFLLSAMALTGCTPPPPKETPTPAPEPASPQVTEQIRDAMMKQNPGAVMGRVELIKGGLAAISGIPYAPSMKDQSVQFVDSNGLPIGSGTVSPLTDPASSILILDQIAPAAMNGRMPIPGDMAVYSPRP